MLRLSYRDQYHREALDFIQKFESVPALDTYKTVPESWKGEYDIKKEKEENSFLLGTINKNFVESYADKFTTDDWDFIIQYQSWYGNSIIPSNLLDKYADKLNKNSWVSLVCSDLRPINEMDTNIVLQYLTDTKLFSIWVNNLLFRHPARVKDIPLNILISRINYDLLYQQGVQKLCEVSPEFNQYFLTRHTDTAKIRPVDTPEPNPDFMGNSILGRVNENLFETLVYRQKTLYQYEMLRGEYKNKPVPDDSKLPILEANLAEANNILIKYLTKVMSYWIGIASSTEANAYFHKKSLEVNRPILTLLENADTLHKQKIAIEGTLNTFHNSGKMIEWLGLTKGQLDYLSNMDTTRWDKELVHMASKNYKHKIMSKIASRVRPVRFLP
jgi:hypothetical protein